MHHHQTDEITHVIHGQCTYNFCRRNVPAQVASLIKEINEASQIGCDLVIHQGKNVISEKLSKLEAIDNYIQNLTDVLEQTSNTASMLLLENSAGQGHELGYSLNELTYIYNQFGDSVKDRIGFCLDTCHIFVAGELDIRKKDTVEQFLWQFDVKIGLDKLKCIHLNDSGIPFGGRRDLHGDLLGGYITNRLLGGSIDGMKYIVQFAGTKHIPLIFETPCLLLEKGVNQPMIQQQIIDQWIDETPSSQTDLEIYQTIEHSLYEYYVTHKKGK